MNFDNLFIGANQLPSINNDKDKCVENYGLEKLREVDVGEFKLNCRYSRVVSITKKNPRITDLNHRRLNGGHLLNSVIQ